VIVRREAFWSKRIESSSTIAGSHSSECTGGTAFNCGNSSSTRGKLPGGKEKGETIHLRGGVEGSFENGKEKGGDMTSRGNAGGAFFFFPYKDRT